MYPSRTSKPLTSQRTRFMQINLHKAITTKSLYSLASERTGVVETGSSLRCTVKHSVMKGKQRQARRRSATGARQGCATRRAHGSLKRTRVARRASPAEPRATASAETKPPPSSGASPRRSRALTSAPGSLAGGRPRAEPSRGKESGRRRGRARWASLPSTCATEGQASRRRSSRRISRRPSDSGPGLRAGGSWRGRRARRSERGARNWPTWRGRQPRQPVLRKTRPSLLLPSGFGAGMSELGRPSRRPRGRRLLFDWPRCLTRRRSVWCCRFVATTTSSRARLRS
mmetsp:Transcript_15324/g.29453  ORF Transcript_15324/g.29453 Transcript_15324/m.29453 type:complete len:286 (+) Transcript_15324:239-1096(+)